MSGCLFVGTAGIASCTAREADASPSVATYLIATLSCAKLWPICLPMSYSQIGSTARKVVPHVHAYVDRGILWETTQYVNLFCLLSFLLQIIHCRMGSDSGNPVCFSLQSTSAWRGCVRCSHNVTYLCDSNSRILKSNVECHVRCGWFLTTTASVYLIVQFVHA